jgi:hypothetical protein
VTLQIGALFRSWLESKPFFLSINVKFNFFGSNVNVGICDTQEGSPKNESCLHVFLHIKYYKVYMNEFFFGFLPKYSLQFLQGSGPIGWLVGDTSMLVRG